MSGQAASPQNSPLGHGEHPSVFHLHLSRKAILALGILLIAPWLLIAVLALGMVGVESVRKSGADGRRPQGAGGSDALLPDRVALGNPGRWGSLEYTQIAIELPDEFVARPGRDEQPLRWFFKGMNKEQVDALFASAGLTGALLDRLRASPREVSLEGCWVTPDREAVVQLPPAAREKIYSVLLRSMDNFNRMDPTALRPEWLEERLQESDLSASAVSLFRSLLYQQSGSPLLVFADMETALRQLAEDQRRNFVKMVSRKITLLIKLRVTPESNIDELVHYWGLGGRTKDLQPLLASLKRVEGGCRIDVVHLLPRFVRQRMYTYPVVDEAANNVKQDCFWTAFNVFNDVPDDRFADLTYAAKVLQQDYQTILNPTQLGDLIFLATESGDAVHAATYIADDIVFTKNGATFLQPWLLMRLEHMMNVYSVCAPADRPLQARYYRRKTL